MPSHQESTLTYDLSLLRKSERKWAASEGLRAVYGSIFNDIHQRLLEGPSLELGSGIGNIKERIPSVVTSDLIETGYADITCSAYDIPLPQPDKGEAWANIIAVDMLHHLCRPMEFFKSAAEALHPGGNIILVEPAATAFGRVFYSLFHPEPILPGKILPPFEMRPDTEDGQFANMGMGVSLFRQHRAECLQGLEAFGLELCEVSYRDIFAYPLTGGYSGPSLAPVAFLKGLLRLEQAIPQVLLKVLALRMIVVIRKV